LCVLPDDGYVYQLKQWNNDYIYIDTYTCARSCILPIAWKMYNVKFLKETCDLNKVKVVTVPSSFEEISL
jgi:hypothetical protein